MGVSGGVAPATDAMPNVAPTPANIAATSTAKIVETRDRRDPNSVEPFIWFPRVSACERSGKHVMGLSGDQVRSHMTRAPGIPLER
jgi:hypothetical protein